MRTTKCDSSTLADVAVNYFLVGHEALVLDGYLHALLALKYPELLLVKPKHMTIATTSSDDSLVDPAYHRKKLATIIIQRINGNITEREYDILYSYYKPKAEKERLNEQSP